MHTGYVPMYESCTVCIGKDFDSQELNRYPSGGHNNARKLMPWFVLCNSCLVGGSLIKNKHGLLQ